MVPVSVTEVYSVCKPCRILRIQGYTERDESERKDLVSQQFCGEHNILTVKGSNISEIRTGMLDSATNCNQGKTSTLETDLQHYDFFNAFITLDECLN